MENYSLETLIHRDNRISSKAAANDIAQMLFSNKTLTEFDISGKLNLFFKTFVENSLKNAGTIAIAKSLTKSVSHPLRLLNISATACNNGACAAVATMLAYNPSLKVLHFSSKRPKTLIRKGTTSTTKL